MRYYNGSTDRKQGDGTAIAFGWVLNKRKQAEDSKYHFPSQKPCFFTEMGFLSPTITVAQDYDSSIFLLKSDGYYFNRSTNLAVSYFRTENTRQ